MSVIDLQMSMVKMGKVERKRKKMKVEKKKRQKRKFSDDGDYNQVLIENSIQMFSHFTGV